MEKFYSELAEHYDKIYHYIDYKKQSKEFLELIKQHNKSNNKKILDACCGTGTLSALMQEQGFEVTGLDKSNEMLKVARKKHPEIRFLNGDMKHFTSNERFGAITCTFNSILYNKNALEMRQAFENFSTLLETGGVLVFNMVDKAIGVNSKRENLPKYREKGLTIEFRPQWKLNKSKNLLEIDIEFTINGKKHQETHQMGAFTQQEMKNLLQATGYQAIALDKSTEYPFKTIFVARKL